MTPAQRLLNTKRKPLIARRDELRRELNKVLAELQVLGTLNTRGKPSASAAVMIFLAENPGATTAEVTTATEIYVTNLYRLKKVGALMSEPIDGTRMLRWWVADASKRLQALRDRVQSRL